MARLEVLAGFNKGQSFPLDAETFVGRTTDGWRSGDNLICVPDPRVSRRHARLARQGDGLVIEDLGSTNGVMVHGKRLAPYTPYTLRNGDQIRIASTCFLVRTDASDGQHASGDAPGVQAAAGSPGQDALPAVEHVEVALAPAMEQNDAQPKVIAVLDASVDPAQIAEAERQSRQGLQEALRRLQVICQVSTALGTLTDREILFEKILHCVFEIFPGAERAFIMLQQKDRGTRGLVTVITRQDTAEQTDDVPLSETIIHEVVTHKHAILSYDALGDERFSAKTSVIGISIRSMMCAPLLVGDEILGLIQVDSRTSPRCFTTEDLQILNGISTQAAMAVKNMQLYEAVEVETARRTNLQRYFSPRLVDMLMSGDITTELGGSIYQGVVMFADIIGFTARSEAMAPTDLMALLNRYFTSMQRVIYEHSGNVDKLSGDGIMAFWGGPHAEHQEASDAVIAALQMQKQLWFLNRDLATEAQQPLYVGIGIHTGEFIAGNVGSEDKIDFTLLGDTVNLAARIERLASRHQVLVSEATWQAIKPLAYAVQLPPIKVKGKSAPVTLYSVRGIRRGQQNGYLMALPCAILHENGDPLGDGFITAATISSSDRSLRLRTTIPLTRGSDIHLRLTLPEYHEPLECSARVLNKLPGGHRGTVTHSKAVLTAIRGASVCHFLTPGHSVATTYRWDDLTRG